MRSRVLEKQRKGRNDAVGELEKLLRDEINGISKIKALSKG